jgi:hypothetical protein
MKVVCIGEGPEYRPFRDLRSLHEAGRPREQVENQRRACTQVFILCKAELGFFHFLEKYLPLVRRYHYSLAGTFHSRRS